MIWQQSYTVSDGRSTFHGLRDGPAVGGWGCRALDVSGRCVELLGTRQTTGMLLVGATDWFYYYYYYYYSPPPTHTYTRRKHEEVQILCSVQAHCANAFRVGSNKRHSPRNLAHAHLPHSSQESSPCR
jgi:hypothetical protein